MGRTTREKFLRNTPALAKLIFTVKNKAKRGYIKGLDGRRVPVRHMHAALNTLLQSAGAFVCKMWVVEFHRLMQEQGYIHGVHYKQAAFVHDELQIRIKKKMFPTTREETEDGKIITKNLVGDICVQAIANVGERLKVRVPLTGEYSVGRTYAETH